MLREMVLRAATCAVELQQEAGLFVHRRIRLELHIGYSLSVICASSIHVSLQAWHLEM